MLQKTEDRSESGIKLLHLGSIPRSMTHCHLGLGTRLTCMYDEIISGDKTCQTAACASDLRQRVYVTGPSQTALTRPPPFELSARLLCERMKLGRVLISWIIAASTPPAMQRHRQSGLSLHCSCDSSLSKCTCQL